MTGEQFASLAADSGSDSFKTDPPNAVLTWLDGDKVHEAEVVITDASVLAHGRAISFEVKLEAGQALIGQMQGVSMFIDAIPRLCGPKTTKLMLHYCAKCMGDTCG
jgi:hypothetical protein